ncbi:hypothetical protein, partial [Companilactobacillus sp.]|uniref:hypothetical protein n=1 Tax=Companilactobacillus sp. TaxID=2767905 RepID=UPI00261A894F
MTHTITPDLFAKLVAFDGSFSIGRTGYEKQFSDYDAWYVMLHFRGGDSERFDAVSPDNAIRAALIGAERISPEARRAERAARL